MTIPLKEQVAAHLDGVDGAASVIGAVNTIVRGADGKLLGHNTDWIGICQPLKPLLRSRSANRVAFQQLDFVALTSSFDSRDCHKQGLG